MLDVCGVGEDVRTRLLSCACDIDDVDDANDDDDDDGDRSLSIIICECFERIRIDTQFNVRRRMYPHTASLRLQLIRCKHAHLRLYLLLRPVFGMLFDTALAKPTAEMM